MSGNYCIKFWPTHQFWCLKSYDNLAIKNNFPCIAPFKISLCLCLCVIERERQRVNMSSRDQPPGNDNNPDQSEIEKLTKINEKQEKRIRALEAKALQLTNLYFVFQGVILSTCASARSIKCHHWWIPFVLSLLAAILNLFAFYFTVDKILSCREHFDQNSVHLGDLKARSEQNPPGDSLRPESPDPCKKRWRRVLAYASIGLSLGFSGVVLYGCHAILCYKRSNENGIW